MFHANRRHDCRVPGILEAPPAEKSVTPKCAEIKLKLNGGQCVCNFEEKSLLKAHFLGSNEGIWGSASSSLRTSERNGSALQLRKSHQL